MTARSWRARKKRSKSQLLRCRGTLVIGKEPQRPATFRSTENHLGVCMSGCRLEKSSSILFQTKALPSPAWMVGRATLCKEKTPNVICMHACQCSGSTRSAGARRDHVDLCAKCQSRAFARQMQARPGSNLFQCNRPFSNIGLPLFYIVKRQVIVLVPNRDYYDAAVG